MIKTKNILIIAIVLALIALCYNTILYLNYGVSLKYEVEHAEMIYGESDSISSRRQEIEGVMGFSRLVFVVLIGVIFGAIFWFKFLGKKK